jgi:putative Mg2+ transporter-C (MgtC) family protein
MKTSSIRTAIFAVVPIATSYLLLGSEAWAPVPQQRLFRSSPIVSYSSPLLRSNNIRSLPVLSSFQRLAIKKHETQERTNLKHRRRRRLLWTAFAIALATLTLHPLRAIASSVLAEPLTGAVASEATTLLAVSTAAPAIAQAVVAAPVDRLALITACSPVSAAVETQLSLRLIYAACMGACLGKERSFAKHSAGVRTMALVAMGASAFTICSAYGFLAFPGKYDPSRMAANVASGVGFVGAGVITTTAGDKSQNVVHGLTTAATIWLSAGVGVACGVGLFRIATTASLATISILRLGRGKPKIRTPAMVNTNAEDYVEGDDDDNSHQGEADFAAETHDTTDWDENISEEPPEVEVILPKVQEQPEKWDDYDSDIEMEQVVTSAWRNATDHTLQADTLAQFQNISGNRP